MIRLASLTVAAALLTLPVAVYAQGKSDTAPGRTPKKDEQAPGQTSDPKANAPGQKQKKTGEPAKKFAPGQDQKTAPKSN